MPHLDEGRLTALLDGELDATERREAEEHLAGCATCRELLTELQAFAGEADRLVNAIVVPPLLQAPATPGVPGVAPGAGTAPAAGRMARYRALAWAASLVLAVGLGYTASALRSPNGEALPAAAARDELKDLPAEPARANSAVASPVPIPAAPPAAAPTGEAGTRAGAAQAAESPRSERAKQAVAPQAVEGLARNEASDVTAEAVAPAAPNAMTELEQRAPAPPAAMAAGRMAFRSTTGLQPIQLEAAVNALGGTIRLIDGLIPAQVLLGTGELLSGADPQRAAVRVVYLDPPGRELWLEQQAPLSEAETDRHRAARDEALLPGDTLAFTTSEGRRRLQWTDATGFRLGLTGQLPVDSLRRLLRRVH